jgi:hypothetical protein
MDYRQRVKFHNWFMNQLRKLSEHYVVFWELNVKNVVYANNPHDLEALEHDIHEGVYNTKQCNLQQVS